VDNERARYTTEFIDPINDRVFTIEIYPYSWGYKSEIRDTEQGDVLRSSNMQKNFTAALEDARDWIKHRHNEIRPGGFAKDGRWIDGREDDDEWER
jgi:hypothetical protein